MVQVDSIHARTLTFMDDKSSFSKSFPALVYAEKRPYKRLTDEKEEFKAWNFGPEFRSCCNFIKMYRVNISFQKMARKNWNEARKT